MNPLAASAAARSSAGIPIRAPLNTTYTQRPLVVLGLPGRAVRTGAAIGRDGTYCSAGRCGEGGQGDAGGGRSRPVRGQRGVRGAGARRVRPRRRGLPARRAGGGACGGGRRGTPRGGV